MATLLPTYTPRTPPRDYSPSWTRREFVNVLQGLSGVVTSILGPYDVLDAERPYVTDPLYPRFDVRRYGCVGDGVTDSTQGFLNAVAAATALNLRTLYMPAGLYVVTTPNVIILTTAFTFYGDGIGRSWIVYRPSGAGVCLTVNAGGGNIASYITLRDFAFWSDDLTTQKTALDLVDVSVCSVERVGVFGAGNVTPGAMWVGSNSIGFHTHGRERVTFSDTFSFADRPYVMGPNPNTARTDGEDVDHFHFTGCYGVADSHPVFEVESGCGFTNLTIDGDVAAVGGTAFFKANDTRVAPTVPTRNLRLADFRHEQATSAAGYSIDVTCTQPNEQTTIANGKIDATIQGVKLDGFYMASVENVTSSRGSGNAIQTANMSGALSLNGFYAQPGSSYSLVGGRTSILAYDAGLFAGPSHATYAMTRSDTAVDVDGAFFGNSLYPPSVAGSVLSRQSTTRVFADVGAPNNSLGSNNDFYFRGDGGAGTLVYHKAAGVWTGIL